MQVHPQRAQVVRATTMLTWMAGDCINLPNLPHRHVVGGISRWPRLAVADTKSFQPNFREDATDSLKLRACSRLFRSS